MEDKEAFGDVQITLKLVLLGDWGAGKSNLLLKYTDNTFNEDHATTIGVDFKIKKLTVKNELVKLKICDTAGHERFRVVTSSYYRGIHAALLCCDMSSKDGFVNIAQWADEIKRYAPSDTTLILVGTKSDLPQLVEESDIKDFCAKAQIHFWKTSAKNGENVETLFLDAADAVYDRLSKIKSTIRLNPSDDHKKKGKCFL